MAILLFFLFFNLVGLRITAAAPSPVGAPTSSNYWQHIAPPRSSPSPSFLAPAPPIAAPPRPSGKRGNGDARDDHDDDDSDDNTEDITPLMHAIAAKRHGGGKEEGIIAGVVFACILLVLFAIGSAYIYVTARYNLDRASSLRTQVSDL